VISFLHRRISFAALRLQTYSCGARAAAGRTIEEGQLNAEKKSEKELAEAEKRYQEIVSKGKRRRAKR